MTQYTTSDDTDDITWTIRVKNTGTNLDRINFTLSGEFERLGTDGVRKAIATLDPDTVVLDPDAYKDIILTVPRALLPTVGNVRITVTGTSATNALVSAKILTDTIVTAGTGQPPPTTPGTGQPPPTTPGSGTIQSLHTVVISEFMFEGGGGTTALPQWIEVYNASDSVVNLNGWKLQWNSLQPAPIAVATVLDVDFRIPPQQARLIVTALGKYSGSNLSNAAVYELQSQRIADSLLIESLLNITDGFSLKLVNPAR